MFEEIRKLSQYFLRVKNESYRRYFIRSTKVENQMSIITGQRGIGKTTTVIQLLLDHVNADPFDKRVLYIPADHMLMKSTTLYATVEHFQAQGCEVIAFDEIHRYPDWSSELKSISDTFQNVQIIASGSSALEIYKGSHDLARRAIRYEMRGMSFREYLELEFNTQFPTITLTDITNNHERIAYNILEIMNSLSQKVLEQFNIYLIKGYYPYFKKIRGDIEFRMTLEQNVNVTLESDLVAIYPHLSGTTINKLKKVLAFISETVPFIPNWEQIKNIVEAGDARTIKNYFTYLEKAQLIRMVPKASQKMSKLDSVGKVYFENSNFLDALAHDKKNKGTMRETFFLSMSAFGHDVELPVNGDFLVNKKYIFEIGGRKKSFEQIKDHQEAFCACDDMEIGAESKIPLWLFGFLY